MFILLFLICSLFEFGHCNVSVVESLIHAFIALTGFWTPCIVHSLNLALKSISSYVTWIGNIIEDARHIRNFVQNHTNALTIYKEYTHLSLLKIADTRFASSFIMLKRSREVKPLLGP